MAEPLELQKYQPWYKLYVNSFNFKRRRGGPTSELVKGRMSCRPGAAPFLYQDDLRMRNMVPVSGGPIGANFSFFAILMKLKLRRNAIENQ